LVQVVALVINLLMDLMRVPDQIHRLLLQQQEQMLLHLVEVLVEVQINLLDNQVVLVVVQTVVELELD
jgi:hypothetical protein